MRKKIFDFSPPITGQSTPRFLCRTEVFYATSTTGSQFALSPGVNCYARAAPSSPLTISGGAIPSIWGLPAFADSVGGAFRIGKGSTASFQDQIVTVGANQIALIWIGASYPSKITPPSGYASLARADGRKDYYSFSAPVPSGLPIRAISATAGLRTKALTVSGPTEFVLGCVGYMGDDGTGLHDVNPTPPVGFDELADTSSYFDNFSTEGIFTLFASKRTTVGGTFGPYTVSIPGASNPNNKSWLAAATVMIATTWNGA